jgi:hypothetical protein
MTFAGSDNAVEDKALQDEPLLVDVYSVLLDVTYITFPDAFTTLRYIVVVPPLVMICPLAEIVMSETRGVAVDNKYVNPELRE